MQTVSLKLETPTWTVSGFNKRSESLCLCRSHLFPVPPTHRSEVKATLRENKPDAYRHLRDRLTCICTALWLSVFNKHGCVWGIRVYCVFKAVSGICRCRMWQCIHARCLIAEDLCKYFRDSGSLLGAWRAHFIWHLGNKGDHQPGLCPLSPHRTILLCASVCANCICILS